MFSQEKLFEEAKRLLSIPSDEQSGNEEVVRHLHSFMLGLGFKAQMQPVQHSIEGLSKRQYNLIGFSSDTLVDRTTKRGVLLINPLDVSTGNLAHLWSATQGNPYAPVLQGNRIVGVGANQGKLDFFCRIVAATELLEKRHKVPLYLVGTAASQYGMLGSRFLIESRAVNPAKVISFVPSDLQMCDQSTGQLVFSVEVESQIRDRDPRGYNRFVTVQALGLSADFSAGKDAINAYELLMELLLDATANGFDYQWSKLETRGAQGANPDMAEAQIYLTAFQFEDFKQFMRNRLQEQDRTRFFRVDFIGVTERAVSFLSPELIEVILELEYEWKELIDQLNINPNPNFEEPKTQGALIRVESLYNGKTKIQFEMRHMPNHSAESIEVQWKEQIQKLFKKHSNMNFGISRDRTVPAQSVALPKYNKNTNYLSDAGWFAKANFQVESVGIGSVQNLPKGPNESIRIDDLDRAIQYYRELVLSLCP
jgi:acetylornithine deacetylase/succinyl-diaminopimelate desuccinylase-like protein